MKLLKAFVLNISLLSTLSAGATSTAIFGPEFTFTTSNGRAHKTDAAQLIECMKRHLIDGQPPGSKFEYEKSVFFSPNGWWFEVSNDQGVIEVQMSPLSVADFKKYRDDINDAIFVSAANEGLFPWLYMGGGHLNFNVNAFGDDLLLARNFVVDFFNHNELSMGIFGYDTNNALPFALETPATQAKFQQLLDKVDMSLATGEKRMGLGPFFLELYYLLGEINPFTASWHEPDNAPAPYARQANRKFVALHFGAATHPAPHGRIEIRSVRPQASLNDWINQIELIDRRIEFLKTINRPLKLQLKVPLLKDLNLSMNEETGHLLNPPISAQKAFLAFYDYVSECGLNWQDHQSYIWPKWVSQGELAEFESSAWFRGQERRKKKIRCENLLTAN